MDRSRIVCSLVVVVACLVTVGCGPDEPPRMKNAPPTKPYLPDPSAKTKSGVSKPVGG